jgi:hypothetical protein
MSIKEENSFSLPDWSKPLRKYTSGEAESDGIEPDESPSTQAACWGRSDGRPSAEDWQSVQSSTGSDSLDEAVVAYLQRTGINFQRLLLIAAALLPVRCGR